MLPSDAVVHAVHVRYTSKSIRAAPTHDDHCEGERRDDEATSC
jgi:hypothetical protein